MNTNVIYLVLFLLTLSVALFLSFQRELKITKRQARTEAGSEIVEAPGEAKAADRGKLPQAPLEPSLSVEMLPPVTVGTPQSRQFSISRFDEDDEPAAEVQIHGSALPSINTTNEKHSDSKNDEVD